MAGRKGRGNGVVLDRRRTAGGSGGYPLQIFDALARQDAIVRGSPINRADATPRRAWVWLFRRRRRRNRVAGCAGRMTVCSGRSIRKAPTAASTIGRITSTSRAACTAAARFWSRRTDAPSLLGAGRPELRLRLLLCGLKHCHYRIPTRASWCGQHGSLMDQGAVRPPIK